LWLVLVNRIFSQDSRCTPHRPLQPLYLFSAIQSLANPFNPSCIIRRFAWAT
jgi:hypothetical protein